MKAKFGMIVTEGRGKIGGHVASRNRSGAYFRTKVTGVNPQTANQQAARQLLTNFSQEWRGLTQAQRDAWDSAVADFATTDIFGDLRNPTGKNLYTRLNINLQISGQSSLSEPPVPSMVASYVVTSLTAAVGASDMEIAFAGSSADDSIHIWMTAPVSPGVSFVKNRFRLLEVIAGNTASPYNAWAAYVARFGTPPVGQKIYVKLVGCNDTTGQTGIGSQNFDIVAA